MDDVRYWDIRENIVIKEVEIKPPLLKSSSTLREDRKCLELSNLKHNK